MKNMSISKLFVIKPDPNLEVTIEIQRFVKFGDGETLVIFDMLHDERLICTNMTLEAAKELHDALGEILS